MRLTRPGSATHVTDFDQRPIALRVVRRDKDALTVSVPGGSSLIPPGWYMVFATDRDGIPSRAAWVHVR
ncbi:DUF1929 domain-containing protein [Streptomyces flavofungini]|nr:DUF1929 domain-containing protein [Streptomyces flavofungini]WJV45358.1 DUF1929 domain-containing protein [Streptomyces flavofungini]